MPQQQENLDQPQEQQDLDLAEQLDALLVQLRELEPDLLPELAVTEVAPVIASSCVTMVVSKSLVFYGAVAQLVRASDS